jgi:hypothetical protein
MTDTQLKQIADCGFTQNVKSVINLKNSRMLVWGSVYYLYDKDVEFQYSLPKTKHLSICLNIEQSFVQIDPYNKGFNHLAAIKKMIELGLIN